MKIVSTYIETPLGNMIACATDKGICLLEFIERETLNSQIEKLKKSLSAEIEDGGSPFFDLLKQQIEAYFNGKLKQFDIPLDMIGTGFQKKVWNELLNIPYGSTHSYMQQSKALGDAKAVRAVANANGMNKIAIIIPCHRVIGSNGSLTGYAGGLWRKQKLLDLENGTAEINYK